MSPHKRVTFTAGHVQHAVCRTSPEQEPEGHLDNPSDSWHDCAGGALVKACGVAAAEAQSKSYALSIFMMSRIQASFASGAHCLQPASVPIVPFRIATAVSPRATTQNPISGSTAESPGAVENRRQLPATCVL